MRNAALGALFVAGLWMLFGGTIPVGSALLGGPGQLADSGESGLVTLATPAGENRQVLVVIDPRTQAMSVYHVDLPTGSVALKCVRNLHWDLQMVEFNGASPLPREIRSMLEPR